MPKISAIIADVDGVMVGKISGVNFPLPHVDVIRALKLVADLNIPVVLCTAKFNFAIQEIARKAHLDNPHITDGGALIINLIDGRVIKKYIIDELIVQQCIQLCLEANIYLEIYTSDAYYIQANQVSSFTAKRTKILQKAPSIVESILSSSRQQNIIKMITFTDENTTENVHVERIIKQLGRKIHFIWSYHPYLTPMRPGVITATQVSKADATKEVVKNLGISFRETLAIGDSKSDWNFMSLCTFVGVVGKEEQELQALAKTKGEGNYFIAPSVNDHGLLEVLKYFRII